MSDAQKPSPAEDGLPSATLEKLFGAQSFHHDLRAGTVAGISDVRTLYLNTDLIRGICEALQHEAGDSWKIILGSCGYIWGRRLAARLDKELDNVLQQHLGQLTVAGYARLLEGYFTKNGWGTIVIHLNDAQDYGFVRVSLQQSIFADALKHIEGPVDFMIAGMLRGMFETISGHSLDCLQICCAGTSPDQSSEFLISAPGRMAALSKEVGQGISVDDAIARLRSI